MIQARFLDNLTIEVIVHDGEKFIWNTYFLTPIEHQQYYLEKLVFYHDKYYHKSQYDISDMLYSIWKSMNFDERLGIYGGKGDRDDERKFINEERVRIGNQIRELRKEKNIEAKALAKATNIDASNLSRIEQGKYSVGIDILSKLAFTLGCHIDIVPNKV